MDMRPPNDQEWDTLPHILLTGYDIWNPSCLDDEFSVANLCLDAPPDTGDQDPRVSMILANTPVISTKISI